MLTLLPKKIDELACGHLIAMHNFEVFGKINEVIDFRGEYTSIHYLR